MPRRGGGRSTLHVAIELSDQRVAPAHFVVLAGWVLRIDVQRALGGVFAYHPFRRAVPRDDQHARGRIILREQFAADEIFVFGGVRGIDRAAVAGQLLRQRDDARRGGGIDVRARLRGGAARRRARRGRLLCVGGDGKICKNRCGEGDAFYDGFGG